MIICAAGDIHGALDGLFEDVLAFEASLGTRKPARATSPPGGPSAGRPRAAPCSSRATIDTLLESPRLDVLLTHDAPAGVVFPRYRRGLNWVSEAVGLDDLVRGTRPRVCFFGDHHMRLESQIDGVPCMGLNKVRMPGNLVATDVPEGSREWTALGDGPERR